MITILDAKKWGCLKTQMWRPAVAAGYEYKPEKKLIDLKDCQPHGFLGHVENVEKRHFGSDGWRERGQFHSGPRMLTDSTKVLPC